MTFLEQLNGWYAKEVLQFQQIPFVQSVFVGTLTKDGYTRFLQEYYHFVHSAAPMYAAATSRIPYSFPRAREWFAKYTYKELDHDEFIVKDLEALGIPASVTRASRPCPEIDALIGYNLYFIERRNPVGVLGTAYLMGKLSAGFSLGVAGTLQKALNLPEEAVSFFFAHGHLDKEQPEDVSVVLQTISEKSAQEEILFNARTVFMLYQNFFRSMK